MSARKAGNGSAKPDPFANVPGRTDLDRQEAGEWFGHEQIPGFSSILDREGHGLRRVEVRGRQTRDYEEAIDRITIQSLRMDAEERYRFSLDQNPRAMAKHCVVSWDWTTADGQEIPCTHENKLRVFQDKSLADHANFIVAAIQVIEGRVRAVVEEDEGKSAPRSVGLSTGQVSARTGDIP